MLARKLKTQGTPKVSKSEEVVEVIHPHWKRKNLVSVVLRREMVLGRLVRRKSLM